MARAALTFAIGGNAKGFQATMDRVHSIARGSAFKLATTFGAAFSVAGVAKFGKELVDLGGRIADMSSRTGLGTTSIQELDYAAKLCGGSMEGLEKAVNAMQRQLGAPEPAKNFVVAINRIGLTLDQLKGRTPDEQFKTLMQAAAGVVDPTERAAVAMALFGKAGTDLLPLMEGGAAGFKKLMAEAGKYGVILDEGAVAATDAFGDSLSRLGSSIKAVAGNSSLPTWLGDVAKGLDVVAGKLADVSGAQRESKGLANALGDAGAKEIGTHEYSSFWANFIAANQSGEWVEKLNQKRGWVKTEGVVLDARTAPGVQELNDAMARQREKAIASGQMEPTSQGEGPTRRKARQATEGAVQANKAEAERQAERERLALEIAALKRGQQPTPATTAPGAASIAAPASPLPATEAKIVELTRQLNALGETEAKEALKKASTALDSDIEATKKLAEEERRRNKELANIGEELARATNDSAFLDKMEAQAAKIEKWGKTLEAIQAKLSAAKAHLALFGVTDLNQGVLRSDKDIKQAQADASLQEKIEAHNRGDKFVKFTPQERTRIAALDAERKQAQEEAATQAATRRKMAGTRQGIDDEQRAREKAERSARRQELQDKLNGTTEAASAVATATPVPTVIPPTAESPVATATPVPVEIPVKVTPEEAFKATIDSLDKELSAGNITVPEKNQRALAAWDALKASNDAPPAPSTPATSVPPATSRAVKPAPSEPKFKTDEEWAASMGLAPATPPPQPVEHKWSRAERFQSDIERIKRNGAASVEDKNLMKIEALRRLNAGGKYASIFGDKDPAPPTQTIPAKTEPPPATSVAQATKSEPKFKTDEGWATSMGLKPAPPPPQPSARRLSREELYRNDLERIKRNGAASGEDKDLMQIEALRRLNAGGSYASIFGSEEAAASSKPKPALAVKTFVGKVKARNDRLTAPGASAGATAEKRGGIIAARDARIGDMQSSLNRSRGERNLVDAFKASNDPIIKKLDDIIAHLPGTYT